ncbi:hypothetical protein GKQ38_02400 [Candidatus Nanohaloarchaea archaeon]|nr:hypothetical protein GKQ38_02400 [Candidatus Nanohaloarchaea archaeon]
MASKSAVDRFAAAFVQIHLASILAGIIANRTSGTLHGLATYLFSIHLLAGLIYIFNVKSSRALKELAVKMLAEMKEQ